MRIAELLKSSAKPFPSIEIVPPLKGVTKQGLIESVKPFVEFNLGYINVTCHRDEIDFRQEDDGSFTRHLVRRRISETAVCAAIQSEFKIDVVPHIICGGATADNINTLVQDFLFLGIENVLALRGDCVMGEKRFTPTPGGYRYASELVASIRQISSDCGKPLCIGVGAYPEKHFEAANIQADILNLKRKVDAGADFIITQMFFDNAVFYRFRDMCCKAGINVPIVPGLKPLSSVRQVELLPKSFFIDIPFGLTSEIEAHRNDAAACYLIGQQWCMEQTRDLISNGIPAVHFYTMGRPDNMIEILKSCF